MSFHDLANFDGTNGGPHGCILQKPISDFAENAGLSTTANLLNSFVTQRFPNKAFTFGDVISLAGKTAVELAIPCIQIKWRFGRTSCQSTAELELIPLAFIDRVEALQFSLNRYGLTINEMAILTAGSHGLANAKSVVANSGWGTFLFSSVSSGKDWIIATLNNAWRVTFSTKFLVQFQSTPGLTTFMRLPSDMLFFPRVLQKIKAGPVDVNAAPVQDYLESFVTKDRSVFDQEFARAYAKMLEIGIKTDILQDFIEPAVCPPINNPMCQPNLLGSRRTSCGPNGATSATCPSTCCWSVLSKSSSGASQPNCYQITTGITETAKCVPNLALANRVVCGDGSISTEAVCSARGCCFDGASTSAKCYHPSADVPTTSNNPVCQPNLLGSRRTSCGPNGATSATCPSTCCWSVLSKSSSGASQPNCYQITTGITETAKCVPNLALANRVVCGDGSISTEAVCSARGCCFDGASTSAKCYHPSADVPTTNNNPMCQPNLLGSRRTSCGPNGATSATCPSTCCWSVLSKSSSGASQPNCYQITTGITETAKCVPNLALANRVVCGDGSISTEAVCSARGCCFDGASTSAKCYHPSADVPTTNNNPMCQPNLLGSRRTSCGPNGATSATCPSTCCWSVLSKSSSGASQPNCYQITTGITETAKCVPNLALANRVVCGDGSISTEAVCSARGCCFDGASTSAKCYHPSADVPTTSNNPVCQPNLLGSRRTSCGPNGATSATCPSTCCWSVLSKSSSGASQPNCYQITTGITETAKCVPNLALANRVVCGDGSISTEAVCSARGCCFDGASTSAKCYHPSADVPTTNNNPMCQPNLLGSRRTSCGPNGATSATCPSTCCWSVLSKSSSGASQPNCYQITTGITETAKCVPNLALANRVVCGDGSISTEAVCSARGCCFDGASTSAKCYHPSADVPTTNNNPMCQPNLLGSRRTSCGPNGATSATCPSTCCWSVLSKSSSGASQPNCYQITTGITETAKCVPNLALANRVVCGDGSISTEAVCSARGCCFDGASTSAKCYHPSADVLA